VGIVRITWAISTLWSGLRKFRLSKSSVYRWYTQLDRRRFVYDTWDNGSRLGRVMVECTLFIIHCLQLNLQLHTIDLVRTCHISSFCTVAWQLARFQLTRRIARSLGDSGASCFCTVVQNANRTAKFFAESRPSQDSQIHEFDLPPWILVSCHETQWILLLLSVNG